MINIPGASRKKAHEKKENAFSHGQALRDNIPLTFLKSGDKARIIKINTDSMVKLRKLTAFGIMPGFDIIVIQKYPAVVVQIGFTQVALDDEIASEIIVGEA